jgi:hypothetical protein
MSSDIILSKKDINNIRGALRLAFKRSDYRKEFLYGKSYRVPRYKADGSRHKVDYRMVDCNICLRASNLASVEVDHIDPIGSTLKVLEDVKTFILRLYCPYSNLQIVCKECHKVKTKEDRAALRKNKATQK